MSDSGSVTLWIEQLKQGDDNAARQIWGRYFEQMVAVARRKLANTPRRVSDEEDVALSAFKSLCERAADGQFDRLTDRHDLWPLLLTITARKAVSQMRHEGRQKRGGGAVRGDSVFDSNDSDRGAAGIEAVAGSEPTPEFIALMDEEHQRLLDKLADDSLRRIVNWKMAGHKNDEIAAMLGISVHAVGRKLRLIRVTWTQELA